MNTLSQHLAHHEIERRLRAADHYRRLRWGRPAWDIMGKRPARYGRGKLAEPRLGGRRREASCEL